MGNCDCTFDGCGDGDFCPPEGEESKTGAGSKDAVTEVDPAEDKELRDDLRAPTKFYRTISGDHWSIRERSGG